MTQPEQSRNAVTQLQIEIVCNSLESEMFTPHEMPLSDDLHKRYLALAEKAIAALITVPSLALAFTSATDLTVKDYEVVQARIINADFDHAKMNSAVSAFERIRLDSGAYAVLLDSAYEQIQELHEKNQTINNLLDESYKRYSFLSDVEDEREALRLAIESSCND